MEREAAGTLDESALRSAIITARHSMQIEHHVLSELNQDVIFRIFFDQAVDYQGPDRAVSDIFRPDKSVTDPKKTRVHTMVIAAGLGEIEVVQSSLSQGTDPYEVSIYFGFAISAAASRGHTSIVRLLLDRGVDSHYCGRFGEDALYLETATVAAAKAGHENVIRILMEPKYKHPTSGWAYCCALKWLAAGKHIASVFLLLDRATFPNPSPIHQYILNICSANGCLPLVKAMVERGAAVTWCPQKNHKPRPLELAAREGHENVVSYLLANGAKQDRGATWGDAITGASANGHIGTLKILLQHGADINSRLGRYCTTPLHEAARNNRVETVRFLLEKGAALHVMEDDVVIWLGYQALKLAIQKGHRELVQLLTEGGVNVKSVAADCVRSAPPLIILAKMWAQDDIVALLLELGAEDIDPLQTFWADEFRRGIYPKSSWKLRCNSLEGKAERLALRNYY